MPKLMFINMRAALHMLSERMKKENMPISICFSCLVNRSLLHSANDYVVFFVLVFFISTRDKKMPPDSRMKRKKSQRIVLLLLPFVRRMCRVPSASSLCGLNTWIIIMAFAKKKIWTTLSVCVKEKRTKKKKFHQTKHHQQQRQ